MIQQGRRRAFLRRFVHVLALAGACTLGICAILVMLVQFGVNVPGWCWALLVLPWIAAGIWAWPWRQSDIEIARQIDAANDFGDRLSSAMSFAAEGADSAWVKAQIADTEKRLASAEVRDNFVKKAFAVQKPAYLKWLLWTALASAVLMLLPLGVNKLQDIAEQRVREAEASQMQETQALTPNLDAVSMEMRTEQAEELLKTAEEIDDPELKAAAEELAQILEDDKAGKLSQEEFERRLAALEQKLAQSDPQMMMAEQQKAFDQAVKEAVESMTQMKEDPETQELAEALEKNDYDKAADILKDLLDSTDPKDKQKLEKLAKMFGDLAKHLDPTDPELKEALKRNKELVDQLKKEFDNDKLSDEDKKAFQEAAKKLQEDEKKQEQQRADSQTSKALNKLQKAMDKTAKDLEKQAQPKAEQDGAKPETGKDGAKPETGKNGEQGQNAEKRQDQKNEEGVSQNQAPPNEDGIQGKQQQKDGQEEGEGAEEALRDAAAQKKAQESRDAMRDLAEKMRKEAQQKDQNDPEAAKNAQERQKNMEDFMKRAKGQGQKEGQQEQQGQEQGKEGQEQGKEGQQAQQQGDQGQQAQQQSQGQDQGQQAGGNEQGQQAEGLLPEGSQQGHDTSEGPSTSMDVNLKDEKLTGMDTGETTSEIIESAGQKGFASESYKEVYQTYEKAAEEVLETEEVPQGYRNYVEKYFDMIRPQ